MSLGGGVLHCSCIPYLWEKQTANDNCLWREEPEEPGGKCDAKMLYRMPLVIFCVCVSVVSFFFF